MTDEYQAPRAANSLITNSVEAGGLHTSAADLSLARQTLALVQRHNGERYVHAFLTPNDAESGQTLAPRCRFTNSINTWTSFIVAVDQSSDAQTTFGVPHRVALSHDHPEVMLAIVCDARFLVFGARIQKSTFIASTSTENFGADTDRSTNFVWGGNEWMAALKYPHGWASGAVFRIDLSGLTLPADRMVLLTPQIQIVQGGSASAWSSAGQIDAYCAMLLVTDAQAGGE